MSVIEINAALFSTFFISLLLFLAYCLRWRRYFELGMKLPGPPALPFIGNYLQFTSNDLCKFLQEFVEIARLYGPISRLWFGSILVVVLTDPDSIENVVKQDKLCSRGYLLRKTMEQAFRNGLFYIDGDEWRRHRKIVSSALHTNILEKFVENFAKNSDILANKLKALADGVIVHDIAPYLTRCTLRTMLQTSYRMEINAVTGNDDSTLNNITTIIDMTTRRLLKPWLLIEWIFKATELGKKYYRAFQSEHRKINYVIGQMKRMRETTGNRGHKDEKPSLMDLLIEYGNNSKEEIVGEIATIIGAGTDTTSIACGYVLALLGENQHIQASVMQEQQDIFGDDILRPVRSDDLPRMMYLEQVS
jgi:cytochrome P450